MIGPYELNSIYSGECSELMAALPDNCIDLTVTSPPYDDLRDYEGYTFDFEPIAEQLYRVTKPGGVVVWVVADATKNGSESGTSFKQALYFKDVGFNLHDTMIWNKGGFTATGSLAVRYASVFEYMIILSKGYPRVFNPIKDRPTINKGRKIQGTIRLKNNTFRKVSNNNNKKISAFSQRFNIWKINPIKTNTAKDHPASFPEGLARDHIISWSNPSDLVFDPMCGSGTTCKMAKQTGRRWLGFDISEKYCELARKRVRVAQPPLFMEDNT